MVNLIKEFPEELKLHKGETYKEYQTRVVSSRKKFGLTWSDIRDLINSECNLSHDESTYRKYYYRHVKNKLDNNIELNEVDSYTNIDSNIESETWLKIKKERYKNSDTLTQTNAFIRRLSREETLIEIAHDAASQISSKKLLDIYNEPLFIKSGKSAAILQLSDWHYGIECNNYWNHYNPDIAKQRVTTLRNKVIQKCAQNNCKEIHVVNLSDLISGRIHLSIRLQNRIDVITQIIEVSEMVAELLTDLSKYMEVHYYDCLDNHSRIEPNKKDSLDLESLVRIIPWYLKSRITSSNIHIHDNEFSDDIISFKCLDYNIVGVHGDNDKPIKVVDNLTLLTHQHYDLVLTAHLHHFGGDEKNQTLVVSNGSLMGTDSYAEKLRLSSRPSQNLIIVTGESVADSIHRILLD
jgi:hypothetical protein